MAHVNSLRCRECGRDYEVAAIFTCEWCFGPLEVAYDYEAIGRALSRDVILSRPHTMWRYRELLPLFDGETPVTLGELRTAISEHVRSKIVGEVAQDLTKHPNSEIAAHLKDVLIV